MGGGGESSEWTDHGDLSTGVEHFPSFLLFYQVYGTVQKICGILNLS